MENIKMLLQVKKPHLQSGSLIFFFNKYFINVDVSIS